MKSNQIFIPAKVQYLGETNATHTKNKIYDAYFLEYWQGERDNLHVKCDDGEITDFIHAHNFKIIDDPNHVLTTAEAIVRCITHEYDQSFPEITYGKTYKAIGRDLNGYYLVMDDSTDCYFYPPYCFEIIDDPDGILDHQSVYYSYES